MAGPVTAYNWVQGTTAAIVGPTRSRLRQVVIYAAAAGSFTLKNGSASAPKTFSNCTARKFFIGFKKTVLPLLDKVFFGVEAAQGRSLLKPY